MKIVRILKLNNDGTQSEIVRVIFNPETSEVTFEGQTEMADSLARDGIIDYTIGATEKLYPKDGFMFLENLKFNFKSGYLNATDIEEIN